MIAKQKKYNNNQISMFKSMRNFPFNW